MKMPIIQATEPKGVVVPIYPGRVEREIGGLATESQRLIDTIVTQDQEVRAKLKEANDLLTINRTKGDFALFAQDLDKELDQDPDQLNRRQRFMERANKKKEEVLSSIPDKLLNKKAQLALDNQMVGMIIVQGDKGRKREGEKIVGTAEKQILDAANMGDFDTVKNTIQKIVDIGLKDESWKVQQMAKAEEVGDKSNISIRINSKDPAVVQSLIEDLDKGKYKNINPLERANYRAQAVNNIETIKKTQQIEKNEQEKKQKEAEKLAHDNKEREVESSIRKGQFAEAMAVSSSKLLTGDEQAKWRKDIEVMSKKSDDEVDPVVETINYNFVNELISKEVDPKTIKGYIYSYEFTKATRDKLIDRLDNEVDKAINKERSRAYDFMKSQIMPYQGMQAAVPPLQGANYNKAMNALDDWISENRKAGKPISPKDIRAKTNELAVTFTSSISERQEFQDKEQKEFFEGLWKKKEKKVEPTPTEVKSEQQYKTIDDVKNAYKNKTLSYDEAAKILREKFGVK
jgi:hypothetical protein